MEQPDITNKLHSYVHNMNPKWKRWLENKLHKLCSQNESKVKKMVGEIVQLKEEEEI